jgi:hypothetical protein
MQRRLRAARTAAQLAWYVAAVRGGAGLADDPVVVVAVAPAGRPCVAGGADGHRSAADGEVDPVLLHLLDVGGGPGLGPQAGFVPGCAAGLEVDDVISS